MSDSFKIRRTDNNYFLNILDENGWWNLHLLEKSYDSIKIFSLKPETMKSIDSESNLVRVDSLSSDKDKEQDILLREEFWEGGFSSIELDEVVRNGAFSDSGLVFIL